MTKDEIRVGDILDRVPTLYSKSGLEEAGAQRCVVVYVHPERRFYQVRFDCPGGAYHECFYFRDREGVPPGAPPEPQQMGRKPGPCFDRFGKLKTRGFY